ncbi:MAG: hypothetical protein GY742_21770 [Hyphomicrobiales bacterium]|nr:hypothetical protein [Hyphomicrobiales bacterium]
MLKKILYQYWRSYSTTGLLVGTFFFAFSLTPSLVPRIALLQGVLSGISFAVGYGLGNLGVWLWDYLELPKRATHLEQLVKWIMTLICCGFAAYFLWQSAAWQDSIRVLMQLEPVGTAQPLIVGLLAFFVFVLVHLLSRLFKFVLMKSSRFINRFMPRRVANVVGFCIAATLFFLLIDGLLFKQALRLADSIYEDLDKLSEANIAQPADPLKTGSVMSLINWDSLGRMGRNFISSGPDKSDIQKFFDEPVLSPIRVYAGLRSADTPAKRAKLALNELIRVGGFERSVLIVATPTGTGWLDPAGVDTVEYLHGGDTAIIGVQYSYLASWLSLLVEPGYGAETARALFRQVYLHWTTLSRDNRPKLYLHGLSLGSLSSESSVDLFEIIADPHHGALWAGPPFPSSHWRSVTDDRKSGTPAWLPRFSDGSYVRFTSQQNHLALPDTNWGPIRIVYLQYASDAITFFELESIFRAPAWMEGQRGPDVSTQLRWYPLVTFLQLLVDVMVSTAPPLGYGHNYAPEHYLDGWLEVTQPRGWSDAKIIRLKSGFASLREMK